MTQQQFKNVKDLLQGYYPNADLLPTTTAIELWYFQLGCFPYEAVMAAVHLWAATNKWPPALSELLSTIREVLIGNLPDWSEGWGQLRKAMSYFGPDKSKEALSSLDPITATVVERLGYRELSTYENEAANRAHFRDMFEQVLAQQLKTEIIHPQILEQIQVIRSQRITNVNTPAIQNPEQGSQLETNTNDSTKE